MTLDRDGSQEILEILEIKNIFFLEFFLQVFGAAFKACLENRNRLQKEAGKDPVEVKMIDLPTGGFTREGTFRYSCGIS